MKKILFFCCIVILSLFAFGCTKAIELTEEENQLIAEYAAEILLKYDRNIKQKYNDDSASKIEPSDDEDKDESTVTEESGTEKQDTESTDTEEITSESGENESDNGNANEPDTGSDDSVIVSSDEDKNFNIAVFADVDNVSIKYANYMILDYYPSYDSEGVYIEVTPPSGYKLLVLKFNIENLTNEDQYINLYSKNLDYRIIANNKSAKQMLTILMDDLYTYQGDIESSSFQEAVLLFQVSESVANNIDDLKLGVKKGDAEKIIQLQ